MTFGMRFHGSKTLGAIKQNFVEVECANLKCFILPVYSNFLKKCFCAYSDSFGFSELMVTLVVEMCCARALPSTAPTLESIGFAMEEEGITLH